MNATAALQQRVFRGLVGRMYDCAFSQVQQYEALCKARTIAMDWFGGDSPEAVSASLKTAHVLFTLGESNRAAALVESALRQCVSHEHVRQANVSLVISDLEEAGKLPVAARVLARLIEIEKLEELPDNLASMNRALVNVLARQGKFDAAEEACRRMVERPGKCSNVHLYELDLARGDLCFMQGRYAKAAKRYMHALQAGWSNDGPDSRWLDDAMRCLARAYLCAGRMEEGQELLYRNLRNQERELHPHLVPLAVWRTAEEFFRCSCFLDVLHLFGSSSAAACMYGDRRQMIAYACLGSGDRKRAVSEAREALDTVRQHREAGDVFGAKGLEWIADFHFAIGEYPMALQCLEEARSILVATLGEDSQWAARLRLRLKIGYRASRAKDAACPVIFAPWKPATQERFGANIGRSRVIS